MKPTTDIQFLQSFLSDIEIESLTSIANSPLALGAIKKIILADVYYKGVLRANVDADPTRNAALLFAFSDKDISNEKLGEDLRALGEGVRLVEGGLTRLEKLKSVVPKTEARPKSGR